MNNDPYAAFDRRGADPLDALCAATTAIPTLEEMRQRRLPLDGQTLARTDFNDSYDTDRTVVADLDQANLITSMVALTDLHKVVIDIDLPVTVIASSTPGHFHLFIDKAMDWSTYLNLLEALASAEIIEPGYLHAAIRRGHTAVRLPWVRKGALSLSDCTHGADCQIHPNVNALHNFDPSACTCVGLAHQRECPQWVLPY